MSAILRLLVILTISVSLIHSKTIRISKKSTTDDDMTKKTDLLKEALDIPENTKDDKESVQHVIQALIDEHEDHIKYLREVLSTHSSQMKLEDSHEEQDTNSKPQSKRAFGFFKSRARKDSDSGHEVPQRDEIDKAIYMQQKHLMNHLRRMFAISLRSRYGK